MNQTSKRFSLFCEPCGFRTTIADIDKVELIEIKTTYIQGKLPTLVQDKIVNKPNLNRPRKFKCPKCGRGITIKELQGSLSKAIIEKEQNDEKQRLATDKKKRIEDGQPEVKQGEFFG